MAIRLSDPSQRLPVLILLLCSFTVSIVGAQDDRGWVTTTEAGTRGTVRTKSLILHPAPEPRPSLKYRFIPEDFQRNEGNSEIYYLRAMGFVEQTTAKNRLLQMHDRAQQESLKKGIPIHEVAPYSWQSMSPRQLPIDEVKAYLQLTEFQTHDIARASKMKDFSLDRNVRSVESPISILLPEIQQMRELARTQSIRCRLAVAEDRFDDAFQIAGQQFAMANHLSQDLFLVSDLVGIAIAGIAWNDALDMVQMPNASNLYWALATLPQPLVPLRRAFSFEYEFFDLEVKALAEVDETPRPAAYWADFIDRVLPQYQRLIAGMGGSNIDSVALNRLNLINMIAAGYPGSKQFLIESEGMDLQLVESYPKAQVFFLAQRKFHEQARDEHFKWSYLELGKVNSLAAYQSLDERLNEYTSRVGWAAKLPGLLLPAIQQVTNASTYCETLISMLQVIELIRMDAAKNGGRLPMKLADLSYPVPENPSTGKPFDYEVNGEIATLTAETSSIVYRLNLQIAR